MEWEWHAMGLDTNIPVTDWKNSEKHVHRIHGIRAISLPDRKARLEVDILRVSIGPTTQAGLITTRLKTLHKKLKYPNEVPFLEVCRKGDFDITFMVKFQLENGEQFCNTVIALVRELFVRFGADDGHGYHLADFKLRQDDFVRFENAWISFVRWLRIENQLPVDCLGDKNIPLAAA